MKKWAILLAVGVGLGGVLGCEQKPATDTGKTTAAPTTAKTTAKTTATAKATAAPAEPLGECPKASVLNEVKSEMSSFKEAGELDFKTLKTSMAISKRDGQRLYVYLANAEFTAAQLGNTLVSPVKEKGQAIVVLSFSNAKDQVTVGKYDPAAGFGKPFWVTAEVHVVKADGKASMVSLGVREGEATILNMTKDQVCGKFDLKSKRSSVSGEFVAKLEVK